MNKTSLHILMLEDEPFDVDLNKNQLLLMEDFDCTVDWVMDKESFLTAINTKEYDIVLSDYNLPNYSGLDALNDLKMLNPLIPFIFVTGAIEEETAAHTIKAGAWDYVVKDRLFRLPVVIRNALKIKEEKIISVKAEEKVQRLLKAIEQTSSQIMVTEKDGKIEYVNKKFLETTGYSLDEIIGKDTTFISPTNNQYGINELTIEKIKRGEIFKGEVLSKRKDNTTYWEFISITPIKNTNNEITNFVAVKEDITERKEIENKLIKALNRAEQSDRLKDAFLENLSHEIRTPMNAIVGFSELLTNQLKPTQESNRNYTSIILTHSYQLLSIVDDILTISLIQTGNENLSLKQISVNELIDSISNDYKQKISDKKLKFKVTKEPIDTGVSLQTDETKLTQILSNLLNNSIKFTHNGYIEFGYQIETDAVKFFVKDTGIGIPEESKEIIFERFVQANSTIKINYGGTGLGLAIARSFAQMLGGKLWVESELDKGSEFFLLLPVNVKENAELKTKQVVISQHDRQLNILVAEDEVDNFVLIKEMFSNYNFKFVHVTNGKDAIECVKNDSSFNLILMDIKMPIMDGKQAFIEIRKMNSKIPIIALTAYALQYEKKMFIEMGFNDYLSKPFRFDELLTKIWSTIEQ